MGDDGDETASTGLITLDHILSGGYARNRSHLIEGQPGAGKTTLALQFLAAGAALGERCLYITLSESSVELQHVAGQHGLSLDGIEIFELVPPELTLDADHDQSIIYAADLELGETVRLVIAAVRAAAPQRVVFDSLSEIRLLAQGALRYRRQVLALKHFFSQQQCTVLLLDDLTQEDDDLNLHSLAHGVIRLEHSAMAYGAERRRLRVYKMRARAFRGGYHDFVIRRGGIVIFPRLVAADHIPVDSDVVSPTGVAALDEMLGGGIDAGTSTLLLGPAGAGKTTLAQQFAKAALDRGERVLFISFDEIKRNFFRRAYNMNLDMLPFLASGSLTFLQIDPGQMSPGEMSEIVRMHVACGVSTVVLDSLSGYQHAMPEQSFLMLQMHELLTYLNQQSVVTILVLTQSGVIGTMQSPLDITYLADTVLMLRFFEAAGEIRRALSVIKKRTGFHERAIRELLFDTSGVQVGAKLAGFRGILSGMPVIDTVQSFLTARESEDEE